MAPGAGISSGLGTPSGKSVSSMDGTASGKSNWSWSQISRKTVSTSVSGAAAECAVAGRPAPMAAGEATRAVTAPDSRTQASVRMPDCCPLQLEQAVVRLLVLQGPAPEWRQRLLRCPEWRAAFGAPATQD